MASSPRLLSFRVALDFNKFVKEHMLVEELQETNEIISRSARIVGQENDGSLLIVWDAPTKEGLIVTHIGIYHPSSPSYRTLFTHETQVDILGATVDHYRSLLAFTICEKLASGVNYDTLVAEINPCNRVFSLNLSSHDFRKLQFIQPSTNPTPTVGKRSAKHSQSLKSSLLVIIPNNWICLYSFQLEPFNKGYTVVSQPTQDMIAQNIPWYQWDPKLQWLCYARFGTTPTQTKRTGKSNVTECSVVLLIVTFEDNIHKVLLTVTLPTPYKHTSYLLDDKKNYFCSPLALTLPVYELNMKVFHNPDGIWCVCLQHGDPNKTKLEYSVYLLHNGHVIDIEVLLPHPHSTYHYINFFLIGNFVIAYVPSVLLHILNIGPRSDPCHHIVLEGKHSPSLPDLAAKTNDQQIITSAVSIGFTSDISSPIFDTRTQFLYSFRLEPMGFFDLFKETADLDLRLSLLHVMIASIQQYSTGLQMIEYICQTPLTLDDPRLFQEFILIFSYTNAVQECPALLSKLLPLTTSLTYSGKIYKRPDNGAKYAIFRCTELPHFFKQLLVQSDQKLVSATPEQLYNFSRTTTDSFGYLCFNCVLNQPNLYKRINLEDIALQVRALALSTPILPGGAKKKSQSLGKEKNLGVTDAKGGGATAKGGGGNLVGRFKDFIQSTRVSSNTDQSSSSAVSLPFLLQDEELDYALGLRFNLFRDRLLQVASSGLKLNSKSSVSSLVKKCERYLSELHKSSHILLHVIWKSLKFNDGNHPLKMSIHRQASTEEEILFELLESFYIAHRDLGITLPPGFATLFISMGYMCLEPSVFIQYLCNNVFIPTKQFLQLLFLDCDRVDEDFLFEIVSNLSYELQGLAFDMWRHPVLQQMITNTKSSSSGVQK